ncbi:MAG: MBL fold metallo-hydrolase [Clostridia bacterium]|nr:MBL fold metallo-hydrolase [Clostridia bacterium]
MLSVSQFADIAIAAESRPFGAKAIKVFVYHVDGLLIDSGPQSLAGELRPWFAEQAPSQVAISHNHEDHAGNAAWLAEHMHVPVYLHPGSIAQAARPGVYPPYRHQLWGERQPYFPLSLPDQLSTDRYHFQVLDTPGHTPCHNCFFEPDQGWLFTGDLYLNSRLRTCFFEEDMRRGIASLRKLLRLDFATVFCAHAGVVTQGKQKLMEKLEFLLQLQQRVDLLRAEGRNDRDISAEIFGPPLPIAAISGGEWSAYHLVRTI